jgi:hypothetical protein
LNTQKETAGIVIKKGGEYAGTLKDWTSMGFTRR